MFTVADVEARANDSREMLRAQELINDDAIIGIEIAGTTCTARVRGSSIYVVTVTTDLAGTCTCPQFKRTKRGFCKHVGAVALAWIGGSRPASEIDAELVAAVERLDFEQLREMVITLAGRSRAGRRRVIDGVWPPDGWEPK